MNKIEIPKDIYRNKINYSFKNSKEEKKAKLIKLSFNKIKYNPTFNNSFILSKKQNSKRVSNNYNKVIIKNSGNGRNMSYKQIPKNMIRTFSYRKLFINNNSIKEFKNTRGNTNLSSPLNNRKYPNSEYQSDINMKFLKNRINEYHIANSEKLINLKQNRIHSFKNKKDNMIILDFISFNEGLSRNRRIKMPSDSNINISNNLKINQPTNLNVGKSFIYKKPKNFEINMKSVPQINKTTSNINIKQNFIFSIKNYLNNCKNIKKRNFNYFTYRRSNY